MDAACASIAACANTAFSLGLAEVPGCLQQDCCGQLAERHGHACRAGRPHMYTMCLAFYLQLLAWQPAKRYGKSLTALSPAGTNSCGRPGQTAKG